MSYDQMTSGGRIWIEQRAYHDAREEIGKAEGIIAAQKTEIKHLAEIAGSVSLLAAKIQDMSAGLELAREKREKLTVQIGWFDQYSRRFCYSDQKQIRPQEFAAYDIPVYAVSP